MTGFDTRAGRWWTPRFPLEMLGASLLTLITVVALGDLGRRAHEEAAPAKLVAQAPRLTLPPTPTVDARTAEFIERFALAHVRAPLPEEALAEPETPPVRAPAAAVRERAHPAPAKSIVAVLPPARPVKLAAFEPPAAPEPAPVVPKPEKPRGFHIPLVSDAVDTIGERIPSRRDLLDGVGSVGKRIGAIFGG
jgi:hypothetical protein